MTLELIPNGDLVFKGPFNIVSTTALQLKNSGTERLAYKIKTTAPKRYCVKPNSGFLDAHAIANIHVMLQPQPAGQPDDRSKHKFMVQWVAVSNSYTEDVDNFWKQDLKALNVQDSKLKCIFADEQPAAVVPSDLHGQRESDATESMHIGEHRAQQLTNTNVQPTSSSILNQRASPPTSRPTNLPQTQSQVRSQDIGDDMNKTRLKQEIDRMKEENESLRERLKQQENTLRQRTTGSDRVGATAADRSKPNQQQQKGVVVLGIAFNEQLLIVVFLAALIFGFSLGYFLFSCGN